MLILIILAFTTFISYGQLLLMYFNRDDYSTFYFLQQNVLAKFPYQFNTIWLKLLFPFTGFNPFIYYFLGLILYFTASILIFKFIFLLSKNKMIAFFSALVFASGYVGQDSMVMFISPGLPTLLGLNFLLISLILFLKYKSNGNITLYLLSLLSFSILLFISSFRYFASFLLLVSLDWIYYRRWERLQIVFRIIIITSISILTYLLLPRLFGNQTVTTNINLSAFVMNPFLLLNNFGSFWNIFFPTFFQLELFYYKKGLTYIPNFIKTLIGILPSLLFSLTILFFTFKLYSQLLRKKGVWLFILLSVIVSTITLRFSVYLTKDPLDQISIQNGIIFSLLLLFLAVFRISCNIKLVLFAVIAFISSISTFFLFSPQSIWESTHRYLFPSTIIPSLFLFFFVTKPLLSKNFKLKRYAYALFFIPVFLIFTTHIVSAIKTQNEIAIESNHFKNIYRDLLINIPTIKNKTVIYVEGTTRQLNFATGAAFRVGLLPSEAAVAVHYNINMNKVILSEHLEDIPHILKNNQDVFLNNVFSFIYDGSKLENTSPILRKLLNSPKEQILVTPFTTVFTPKEIIYTLTPLQVTLNIKAEKINRSKVAEKALKVSWQYNTEGPLTVEKTTTIDIIPDGSWHEVNFTIPAGGKYLKEVSFEYILSPEILSIPKIEIKRTMIKQ